MGLTAVPFPHGPLAALRKLTPDTFFLLPGVAAGLPVPGAARCTAIGVSPLSGGVAETRAEGPYGGALRASGVDGLLITGRSPSPVYVLVTAGACQILPADDLWGLETGPATDLLRSRHGPEAAVAVIGPAGENQVRYASIVTCRHHPLPRLGLGAVLGAKLVKAVVCVPAPAAPVSPFPGPTADAPARPIAVPTRPQPLAFERINVAYRAGSATNKLATWQQGWPGFGVWSADPGYATVANFTDTTSPTGVGTVPADIAATATVSPCPGCPTDCIKVYAGTGLHQEGLAMLGPGLGIKNPWPLLARCEQLGLDPVSLGGTLAAAKIAPDDVPAAVERLARRGDPLAEGAARHTPDQAMTCMEIELPPFDPRVQPNLGLAYAASPIGPRYDIVEHDLDFDPVDGLPDSFGELRALGVDVPRPRGELDVHRTAQLMRLWSGLDALGICLFASTPTRPLRLTQIEDLVEAVTGNRPDVLALGSLRLRLQHEVNRRLGVRRGTLPDRFFTEPVRAGRFAGSVLDREEFEEALGALRRQLF